MLDLCCCVDFFAESLTIAWREGPQAQFYEADMRGDLSFLGQFDAAICIAGFLHRSDAELLGGFRSLAELLPAGAPLLLTVKDGEGYAPKMSLTTIDGQAYDRRFCLHTADALCAAAAPGFRYAQELFSGPQDVWRNHLFCRR